MFKPVLGGSGSFTLVSYAHFLKLLLVFSTHADYIVDRLGVLCFALWKTYQMFKQRKHDLIGLRFWLRIKVIVRPGMEGWSLCSGNGDVLPPQVVIC